MTAPERIWAFYAPEIAEIENGATIVAYETVQHGGAEYIHVDLVPDPAALVRAALEAAADHLQSLANQLWPDGNRTELANTIRAIAADPAAVAEIVAKAKGATHD
jgi:hypothetical protein